MEKTSKSYGGYNLLVEELVTIDIDKITKQLVNNTKEAILKSKLQLIDQELDLCSTSTGFGGTRFCFVCPECKKAKRKLFKHPLNESYSCRSCLGARYLSQS